MKVADQLFETIEGVTYLVAGRDRHNGEVLFPFPRGGESERYDPITLPTTGTLWSWTIQRFQPKPPFEPHPDQAFKPYGVGYVRLGDVLIVEGRILADDPQSLVIGQPMRVVVDSFSATAAGEPIDTYAFAPIARQDAQ